MNLSSAIFTLILLTFMSCQNHKLGKINYEHPIQYEPETYVCYKTNHPINIDGKLDEWVWGNTLPTTDFVDIEGDLKPLPPYKTNVKMLWDDEYFYFGAYLEEPHIWGKLTERDAVIYHDNDFEIFIDPDGDTHNYYEFEVNALNTIWDLMLLRPYREDRLPKVLNSWDIKGIQSAVDVNGTINNSADINSFWTVEVAIPWSVLREMTPSKYLPKEGVQWRINFSRVNWHTDTSNDNYEKKKDENGKNLPEENWVWSPQGYIAMHAPETWGFVQFTEVVLGKKVVDFQYSDDEKIKWALRQLYYQQRRYFQQYKTYAKSLKKLNVPKLAINNYTFNPKLIMTFDAYEIIAQSIDNQYVWIIQEDGKIIQKQNITKQ